MHHLIFGHSFTELVALILLLGLTFYFLNKKKAGVNGSAEDANTSASGLMNAPTKTNSGRSSSSPTKTTNGASSSSTTSTNSFEVFLSFRGLDTRNAFTDHLYNGLLNAGIRVFRDDEELRQGEEIGPDLFAGIKNSKILIPILSENYGSSKWCLEELVQIMECKNNDTGHIVLPIFYKVEPAHVRYQKGSFGEAFRERERRERKRHFDPVILEKWKQALKEVGNLKGREANGYFIFSPKHSLLSFYLCGCLRLF